MRSSLQATLGRRRNSKALAVSLQSLSSAGSKSVNSSVESSEVSRVTSRQRPLELIVKDDEFRSASASRSPTPRLADEIPNSPHDRIVKEGRRKGRERGDLCVASAASDFEEALSSASTPATSCHASETSLLRSKETGQVYHLSGGLKLNQLQSSTLLPILEGRLFFLVSSSALEEQQGQHFFTWNAAMIQYFPLCADFGPFNLGMTHRFCQFMKDLLLDQKHLNKQLVMYTSAEETDITNAIYLLGAFLCLHLGARVEEAWTPFSNIAAHPCTPYRDATWVSPSTYDINVTDCWAGLLKAVKMGLYKPAQFNDEEYFYYDSPANGDMHEVVPGKFLAFKGPTEERKPMGNGVLTFLPTDYCAVFEVKGVRTVVRLCEPEYDREWLVNQGYHHHDLLVHECAVPTDSVVDKFLRIAETSKAPLAVHCRSGLGPTPTLIAMYMMKHLDFTADEAIAWLRICRPGSVIGAQQHFIEEQEQRLRQLHAAKVDGLGIDHAAAQSEPVVDAEALQLAEVLQAAVDARDHAKLDAARRLEPRTPLPASPKRAAEASAASNLSSPTDDRRPARRPSSALPAAAPPAPASDASPPACQVQPRGTQCGECQGLGRALCTCSLASSLNSKRAKRALMRQWAGDASLVRGSAQPDAVSSLRASGPTCMMSSDADAPASPLSDPPSARRLLRASGPASVLRAGASEGAAAGREEAAARSVSDVGQQRCIPDKAGGGTLSQVSVYTPRLNNLR